MSGIGQPERAMQKPIVTLFRDELNYRYLGDWTDRAGNSKIDRFADGHLDRAGLETS